MHSTQKGEATPSWAQQQTERFCSVSLSGPHNCCCWCDVSAGAYAGLLVFQNPYIYAVLTILTILPQNSNVTSLNNLVLLFYESGLFQNFAEAVNCVRLVTWLSMGFMVASFAVFK
jgi:hypothetical protein